MLQLYVYAPSIGETEREYNLQVGESPIYRLYGVGNGMGWNVQSGAKDLQGNGYPV